MNSLLKRLLTFLVITLFLVSCIVTLFLATMKKTPYLQIGGKVQEDFYGISDSERTNYLQNHQEELEYTSIDDVYFLINHKDISHTQGHIWIDACSIFPGEEKNFVIKQVSLRTNNDAILFENKDLNLKISSVPANGDIYAPTDPILTYTKSEDWYYKRNDLILVIDIEKNGEIKTISYGVEVCIARSHRYL